MPIFEINFYYHLWNIMITFYRFGFSSIDDRLQNDYIWEFAR
jgi:hypothetical protein